MASSTTAGSARPGARTGGVRLGSRRYLADRPLGEEAHRFIPGARYPEIAARDAAMAGGLGLLACRRDRPRRARPQDRVVAMLTAARLTLKLQRWEIAIVAAACLGLAAAAAWLALDMRAIWDRCGTAGASATCDVIFAFQESHGSLFGLLQTLIGFVPFVSAWCWACRSSPARSSSAPHRSHGRWRARAYVGWSALRADPAHLRGAGSRAGGRGRSDGACVFPAGRHRVQLLRRARTPARDACGIHACGGRGARCARRPPATDAADRHRSFHGGVVVALAIALPHWAPATVLADIESDPAAMIGGRLHTAIHYRLPSGEVVSADEGEMYVEVLHEEAGGEPDPALMPETDRHRRGGRPLFRGGPSRVSGHRCRHAPALRGLGREVCTAAGPSDRLMVAARLALAEEAGGTWTGAPTAAPLRSEPSSRQRYAASAPGCPRSRRGRPSPRRCSPPSRSAR